MSLPTIFWVWSCGAVIILAALFCGLVLLSRKFRMPHLSRRIFVIACWTTAATLISWLLFARDNGQAALVHGQNAGRAVVYIYFWLLAVVPSPVIGFAVLRITRMQKS